MIEYVSKNEDFQKYKNRLNKFLDFKSIDRNPFNENLNYYLAFEFDLILEERFFEGLKKFGNFTNSNALVFYTIDPDPELYFNLYFRKFSVFEIGLNGTESELNEIMSRDPGNSPADAFCFNANIISIFSDSSEWAIIASRDSEIAIVGFSSENVRMQFLGSFDEWTKRFYFSVEEKAKLLREQFSSYPLAVDTYTRLGISYRR